MKRDMEIKIGSTLHRSISSARMSDAEREVALGALRTADLMVDAAEWIVKKLEQFATRLFLRPGLRA